MKKNIFLIVVVFFSSAFSQSFYDLTINGIDGHQIDFENFKGKYVMIVNVASKCGYTSQYAGLQELHESYDNIIVLGVPCNQFANQEPKEEKEILKFCSDNYNVTFPMSQKVNVKGSEQHQVYQWLTIKKKNQLDDFKVSWNFNKFLVDPKGNLIDHFGSGTRPMSDKIISLIK